ncbi:MAG: hypothetical protein NPIRA01_26070 [Nitrospirales bacterium]|nr:MAG: hypothetical protein NPIRA01_26070 [Nitrospirales bacterium]
MRQEIEISGVKQNQRYIQSYACKQECPNPKLSFPGSVVISQEKMSEKGEQSKQPDTQKAHCEIKADKPPSGYPRDSIRGVEQPGYEKNRQANGKKKYEAVDGRRTSRLKFNPFHVGTNR